MYGQWVGTHMKARWIAQQALAQGKHPYDHPEHTTADAKERKGVGIQ